MPASARRSATTISVPFWVSLVTSHSSGPSHRTETNMPVLDAHAVTGGRTSVTLWTARRNFSFAATPRRLTQPATERSTISIPSPLKERA